MFSGIVEEAAPIVALKHDNGNLHLTLKSSFTHELKIDQSVAHNGVCLTVVDIDGDCYTVTAIQETLDRTNLGSLKVGRQGEPRAQHAHERPPRRPHRAGPRRPDSPLRNESTWSMAAATTTFVYDLDPKMAAKGYMTVEKGSVTVNGVSLTVCNSQDNSFQVAIIPYTYEHTNFHQIEVGSIVNLEFDIIGKYISRIMHFEKA